MKRLLNLIFLLCILSSACNKGGNGAVRLKKPGGKEMAELNSYFVEKDKERIISYAERKGLSLTESSTGLFYLIKKRGSGQLLKDKDSVKIDYKCSLLDGTLCYSSEKQGIKELVIGHSEMEAGLMEGLKMLAPGGEAVLVIPPFLAFGLLGDNKLIPPRATIVYEVKLHEK